MGERAVVKVWRDETEPWHPYPWMFSVAYQGVTHLFAGAPNQCETRRQASARARWRARWLESGEFDRRYV